MIQDDPKADNQVVLKYLFAVATKVIKKRVLIFKVLSEVIAFFQL